MPVPTTPEGVPVEDTLSVEAPEPVPESEAQADFEEEGEER